MTAARHVPALEDAIERAMRKSVAGLPPFPGRTGLLVDVSGSMDDRLSRRSEVTRTDVAAGLAILLREKGEGVRVATFSERCVELPARRGFALRDAIVGSQQHLGTFLRRALAKLREEPAWQRLDRLIVVTDEQAHDGLLPAWTPWAYVINVAPYRYGLGYGNGWTHIDGWSERVLDYIALAEAKNGHVN